ncbi:hypothetical protein [Streptomyces sp. NPDC052042]|uniref:hypothetical protein n=1 Tax=Streptomyces sp. NPDC052042 TaxID=3365683 RepID=UPI0037D72E98
MTARSRAASAAEVLRITDPGPGPGARFENLPESVKCWDRGHRNPLRDPGPQEEHSPHHSAYATSVRPPFKEELTR